uniref:Hemopexin n=1 Tax=Chelonoidis abingdonii TaxID=106734 RepID=A0A8C0HGM8_CHEAB
LCPGASPVGLVAGGLGSSRGAGWGGAPQPPVLHWTVLSSPEAASRCADEGGFDAITLDEHGVMLFFRGVHVWKGFHGPAQLINATWPEIQGPVDAALRIHHTASPGVHDNVYLFQVPRGGRQAGALWRAGLHRAAPGPRAEPPTPHRLPLSGHSLELPSPHQPPCLVTPWSPPALHRPPALVWMLPGVPPHRPLLSWGQTPAPRCDRDILAMVQGWGQPLLSAPAAASSPPSPGQPCRAACSRPALGGQYFRLDSKRDGWHSWPLNHTWQELSGQVDSAFSWDNKLYLIQGSQVYIYRVGPGYTLVQGYPRGLQEELGFTGADATFTCPHSAELFVIKGASWAARSSDQSRGLGEPGLLGSLLARGGGGWLHLFHGNTMYHYASVVELTKSPKPSPPQNVTAVLFGCPH